MLGEIAACLTPIPTCMGPGAGADGREGATVGGEGPESPACVAGDLKWGAWNSGAGCVAACCSGSCCCCCCCCGPSLEGEGEVDGRISRPSLCVEERLGARGGRERGEGEGVDEKEEKDAEVVGGRRALVGVRGCGCCCCCCSFSSCCCCSCCSYVYVNCCCPEACCCCTNACCCCW